MNIRFKLLLCSMTMALFYLSAHTVSAAELQLAGVRLGRSALSVIQKYGNPSEVRVGASPQAQGPEFTPGAPMPGAPAMEGMPMGLPGMMAPTEMGAPAWGGQPLGQTAAPRKRAPEVMWIYRFPKNKTLEFVISPDGRVMQIAAYGVEWPGIRTALGIGLGDTYKDVVLKYGFPESHEKTGIELITRYSERHRAVFTFVGNTVVGITVGLMD